MAEPDDGRRPDTSTGDDHDGAAEPAARQLFGAGGPLVSFVRFLADAAQKGLELIAQAKIALVLVTVVLGLLAIVLVLAVVALILQL